MPFTGERFTLPGPVFGVVVKIDLTDPRIHVEMALADNRRANADESSSVVGQLDTPSSVAKKFEFDIIMNASYFAVPVASEFNRKKIQYFVGNGAYPRLALF